MDEEEPLIAELSQDEDPLAAVDPALRTDDPMATAHRIAATTVLSVLHSFGYCDGHITGVAAVVRDPDGFCREPSP
ncbi:hypothetical protein V1227_05105 [Lentzea sp. DG1S-22]|uniref:hypothetical protein n=1 Tax=Lentzea sp. DG1S-22 TaxID=3108822 RepID=UPI002E775432|nr:hypothetical protein [Lentzea sp. DG1S-22]WVH82136.1 hypothetical protein V1227_05105 [Lentzea sp. DG1S-22]